MPGISKLGLVAACALAVPAALAQAGHVTFHTALVEAAYTDEVVCAVSNTASGSVLVDEVRIKDAAGNVLASLPASNVAPMATISLRLFGGGQRRCEADVYDADAPWVLARIYNKLSGRSNDGG